MVTLEDILRDDFGVSCPFDENGKLTEEGAIAYEKLINVARDLGLFFNMDVENWIKTLDRVADSEIMYTFRIAFEREGVFDQIEFCAPNKKEAEELFDEWCRNDEGVEPYPIISVFAVYNEEDKREYKDSYGTPYQYEKATNPTDEKVSYDRACELIKESPFDIHDFDNESDPCKISFCAWSPAGEDLWFEVEYNGTEKDLIQKLHDLYINFDVNEHAEMYINMRGKNGVPNDIKVLYEDAEDIKNMFGSLYKASIKVSQGKNLSSAEQEKCVPLGAQLSLN